MLCQRSSGRSWRPRRSARSSHCGAFTPAGGGADRPVEHRRLQARPRVRRERVVAIHPEVERDAEGEDVRPGVDGAAQVLLRRHKRRRTHTRAGAGELEVERLALMGSAQPARLAPPRLRAREAEVHHLHRAVVGDQHVVWLEVSVHQTDRVRRGEPAAGRDEDLQHLGPCPLGHLEPIADAPPADQLQRHKHLAVEGPDVVDRDHVRVREPRHRLRLAQQPQPRLGVAVSRPQQLDRHAAVELRVVGGVDDPHPALPERLQHHVAAEPRRHHRAARDALRRRDLRRQRSVELQRRGRRASRIDLRGLGLVDQADRPSAPPCLVIQRARHHLTRSGSRVEARRPRPSRRRRSGA
jgi:hypothetical protein